jgi:hypothetical protein
VDRKSFWCSSSIRSSRCSRIVRACPAMGEAANPSSGSSEKRKESRRSFVNPTRKSPSQSGYFRTNDGGKGAGQHPLGPGPEQPPPGGFALAEIPAPLRETTCGLPAALSVKRASDAAGGAGCEVTLMVQLAPDARPGRTIELAAKSVPPTATDSPLAIAFDA